MSQTSDPVTVPADLLPGLFRDHVAVHVAESGWRGVIVEDASSPPALVWLVSPNGENDTMSFRGADEVSVDLARPAGWDAAVDALARSYWRDMADTDRAEFCFADGAWTLFPPARLQRAKPRSFAFQAFVVWREVDTDVSPVEALRRVLHIVSGREG